jgi:hypothetical protein
VNKYLIGEKPIAVLFGEERKALDLIKCNRQENSFLQIAESCSLLCCICI